MLTNGEIVGPYDHVMLITGYAVIFYVHIYIIYLNYRTRFTLQQACS